MRVASARKNSSELLSVSGLPFFILSSLMASIHLLKEILQAPITPWAMSALLPGALRKRLAQSRVHAITSRRPSVWLLALAEVAWAGKGSHILGDDALPEHPESAQAINKHLPLMPRP